MANGTIVQVHRRRRSLSAVYTRSGLQLRFHRHMGFRLWDAVLMTIDAFDPMDIMRACSARVGRVHLLDVDSAVGHLWMTGFARSPCVFPMPIVARDAAEAFVYTRRRAIVA